MSTPLSICYTETQDINVPVSQTTAILSQAVLNCQRQKEFCCPASSSFEDLNNLVQFRESTNVCITHAVPLGA